MAVHRSELATRYSSPMDRVAKLSETKCSAINDAQPNIREGQPRSGLPLNLTLAAMRNQHTSSRFGAVHRAVTIAVLLESYGLASRFLSAADRGHVSRLAVELKGMLSAPLFSRASALEVSRSSLACSLLRRLQLVSGVVVVCRFWLLRAVAKLAALKKHLPTC